MGASRGSRQGSLSQQAVGRDRKWGGAGRYRPRALWTGRAGRRCRRHHPHRPRGRALPRRQCNPKTPKGRAMATLKFVYGSSPAPRRPAPTCPALLPGARRRVCAPTLLTTRVKMKSFGSRLAGRGGGGMSDIKVVGVGVGEEGAQTIAMWGRSRLCRLVCRADVWAHRALRALRQAQPEAARAPRGSGKRIKPAGPPGRKGRNRKCSVRWSAEQSPGRPAKAGQARPSLAS